MTIKWSDIQTEYEGLETSFRQRVVELYLRYEGQETDEKGKNGRPIKVTKNSFAAKMGLDQTTFGRWVTQYELLNASPDSPADLPVEPEPTHCVNEKVPPRKGFVLEAYDRLAEGLTVVDQLSDETQQIILDDIEKVERLLEEIKSKLRVRK